MRRSLWPAPSSAKSWNYPCTSPMRPFALPVPSASRPFPRRVRTPACSSSGQTTPSYAAKNKQRGRPLLFSEVHETAIRRERLVEEYLREADLEGEMEMVFQPILDLATSRVVSFEALARWHSPVLGTVSPAEFVRGAELNGQINELTCVLLRKALAVAKEWPQDIAVSSIFPRSTSRPPRRTIVSRSSFGQAHSTVPPRR